MTIVSPSQDSRPKAHDRFLLLGSLFFFLLLITTLPASAVLTDSYLEDFEGRENGVSLNGIDSWSLTQGVAANAVVQSGLTFSGSGKSLKLIGALSTVHIGRPSSYGGRSPGWIRFRVRPANSEDTPAVPTTGVGAVCLDPKGNLLVADGASWVDSGLDYTVGRWYDVVMKVNFSSHTYDVYFNDALLPDPFFKPIKTKLKFIDPKVNSLSSINFAGSYSKSSATDVYVDDVSISHMEHLLITTVPQKLFLKEPSSVMVVQLQDSNNNAQSAVADITLQLKTTSGKGTFSLDKFLWQNITELVIPKRIQSAIFYYKDGQPGEPIISISEYPSWGLLEAFQQQEVLNQIISFKVEATSPQLAGGTFVVKITAVKEDGSLNEYYDGSLALSAEYVLPLGGTLKLSPDTASGFVKGYKEVNLVYPDAGIIKVKVEDADDSKQVGASPQILFLPAAFMVSGESPQTVSQFFPLSLKAVNIHGQLTPNYQGNMNLTAVPVVPAELPGFFLAPLTVTGTSFTAGTATIDAAYKSFGTIKIKAADSTDSSKQGVSADIKFVPKGLKATWGAPPVGRNYYYLGETLSFEVQLIDEDGGPVDSYTGAMDLSCDQSLNLPLDYAFVGTEGGKKLFTVTPSRAGVFAVSVKTQDGFAVTSPDITIKGAFIQVIDTTAVVGTGQVEIRLVDEDGNIIVDNGLSLNILLEEDNDNQSAYLASGQVTLQDGRAFVSITDSEAEDVTVSATSNLKIKSKKGKIKFGRIGKSGINPLLWREIKEKK